MKDEPRTTFTKNQGITKIATAPLNERTCHLF